MKKQTLIPVLVAILTIAFIFTITSCEKDEEILPSVETMEINEVSATTALAGGIIKDQGSHPVVYQGVYYSSTNSSPGFSDNQLESESLSESFQILVEDLEPDTKYYLRAFAQNEVGISYGAVVEFTTIRGLADVETLGVEDITHNSALAKAIIHDEGDSPVFSKGICYATDSLFPNLESNCIEAETDNNPFEVIIDDLSPGTDYYLRAYAVNDIDTAFGKTVSFSTEYETVTDIDGNEYRILEIGEQTWMIDNLKVTRFSNGDPIPFREENHYWAEGTPFEPAYSYYNNDESYADPYGALYNFATASDERNVCPTGWRVMTGDDLEELVMGYLGHPNYGGKLKATGTIEDGTGLWHAPNKEATNESGFSAIPGGQRDGDFELMGKNGAFWTSRESQHQGDVLVLSYQNGLAMTFISKSHRGFSIRCVKE